MITNQYLEQYMRAVNDQDNAEERLRSLIWTGGSRKLISITPTHFNNFYFKVSLNGADKVNLEIEEAKELSNWLAAVTSDLKDTYHLIAEILKRRI